MYLLLYMLFHAHRTKTFQFLLECIPAIDDLIDFHNKKGLKVLLTFEIGFSFQQLKEESTIS